MRPRAYLFFFVLAALALLAGRGAPVQAHAPLAVQAVIGSGTAASCQTNQAANDFSNAVAAGGLVEFNCGPDTVTITVNTSVVDKQVTVNGEGRIHLSGENLRQPFYVMGTGSLTLNDLVLTDGDAGQGGAIYIDQQAQVTLNRSFVISSHAQTDGGAIYNRGTLLLYDSTLGSNSATVNGGAIFNNGGTVTIRNSYLVSNQAQDGGGLYTAGGQATLDKSAVRSSIVSDQGGAVYANGPLQITNSTFSNNQAAEGGALFAVDNVNIVNATFNENRADIAGAIWNGLSAVTTLKNSIIAGSLDTNGSNPSLNCDGPALISLGRNIITDNTCVPNPGSLGDLLSTDPLLGPWYGSPLRAYLPASNSPAVDYGLDCPALDQRGYPRPIGTACDVGSIEYGFLLYLPAVRR